MSLEQALKSALQLVEQINGIKAEVLALADQNKAFATDLAAREEALKKREIKIGALEEASTMLHAAKKLQEEVSEARRSLENDRVAFSNLTVIERQKIREESDRLIPVRELADQVRRDKAALEVEKVAYKDRIKKELIDGLKAGKL